MKEVPVTFDCKGQQIVGMEHVPDVKNPPTIIMCHGWGGSKTGTMEGLFVKAAREFCRNGFRVIRFDFRGSGDSEGEFDKQTNETLLEDLDCVMNDVGCDVGLIGHSLGGRTVILKTSTDKRIRCLATWAAPIHEEYLAKSFVDEVHQRKSFYFSDIGCSINSRQLDSYLRQSILNAVRKIRVPFLIVNGAEDTSVYPSQARKLYAHASKPKKLAIIEGANHYFFNEKEIVRLTADWFGKWFTTRSGK